VSHLVTLSPKELILDLKGSILATTEKYHPHVVVAVPQASGERYATFKLNFRSLGKLI
jgi:hypothetical protein